MDKHEAKELLVLVLDAYRKCSWDELRLQIDESDHREVTGAAETTYQVQIQFVWDGKPEGDIRVIGAIDDGGWRAYCPVTESFIMQPDGRFVGEGKQDQRHVCEVGGKPYYVPVATRAPLLLGVAAVALALFLHPIHWFAIPVILVAAGTATPHFGRANGCWTWLMIIGALVASLWHPDIGIPLAAWAFVAWFTTCIEMRITMQPYLRPEEGH